MATGSIHRGSLMSKRFRKDISENASSDAERLNETSRWEFHDALGLVQPQVWSTHRKTNLQVGIADRSNGTR